MSEPGPNEQLVLSLKKLLEAGDKLRPETRHLIQFAIEVQEGRTTLSTLISPAAAVRSTEVATLANP